MECNLITKIIKLGQISKLTKILTKSLEICPGCNLIILNYKKKMDFLQIRDERFTAHGIYIMLTGFYRFIFQKGTIKT